MDLDEAWKRAEKKGRLRAEDAWPPGPRREKEAHRYTLIEYHAMVTPPPKRCSCCCCKSVR